MFFKDLIRFYSALLILGFIVLVATLFLFGCQDFVGTIRVGDTNSAFEMAHANPNTNVCWHKPPLENNPGYYCVIYLGEKR